MWARFRCILQMPTPFSTLQRHCTGATFPAFGEVTGKLVLRVIEVTTSQVHMRNTLMLPVVTDAYGGASSCTCVPHTPFTSPLWHTFCKSSATGIASGGALEHAIRIGLLELCVWCHQLGNGKRELGKYSVSPPPIITMGRRIVRYHPPPPHTHTHIHLTLHLSTTSARFTFPALCPRAKRTFPWLVGFVSLFPVCSSLSSYCLCKNQSHSRISVRAVITAVAVSTVHLESF